MNAIDRNKLRAAFVAVGVTLAMWAVGTMLVYVATRLILFLMGRE